MIASFQREVRNIRSSHVHLLYGRPYEYLSSPGSMLLRRWDGMTLAGVDEREDAMASGKARYVWTGAQNGMELLGTLTLPGVDRSVPYARLFLRDTLVPGHISPGSELLADMALVVDELAANGIRHTASGKGGKITIALWAGRGALRAEVTDDGADGARPVVRTDPGGESGRGLHIVTALAKAWGYRPDGHGTTVWADFPIPTGRRRPVDA
jgi:anti-sigma regulatory factor (Ser/Thr protein kinase)